MKTKRVYVFQLHGKVAGATCVVVAGQRGYAELKAKEWAAREGLDTDGMELVTTHSCQETGVVYADNGDY